MPLLWLTQETGGVVAPSAQERNTGGREGLRRRSNEFAVEKSACLAEMIDV